MNRRQPDSPAQNALYALISQAVGAAFTAVITLVLVRLLGPEEYGIYALALGMGVVMLPLLDLGVSISSTRFIAEHRDESSAVRSVIASSLRLKLLISAFAGTALIILAEPIASAYDIPALAWALRAMAIAVVAQSFFLLLVGAFTALARVSLSVRVVFVESSLEAVTSIALVLAGAGAAGAIWGRAIGYAAAVAAGFLLLPLAIGRLRGSNADSSETVPPGWQRIASYAVPLVAVEIVSVAFGQIGVLMTGAYLGATAAGLFEAPLRLSIFLQQGGLALAAGFTPGLAKVANRFREGPRFDRALRFAVLGYAAAIAPLVVWAEPIVALLLGDGYEESAPVLRILAAFTFLAGPGMLVAIGANYLGEAVRRLPIAIATLATTGVLNVILIPAIGIEGAAISSVAGYLIYVPGQYWLCAKALGLDTAGLLRTVARALLAAVAMGGALALFGVSDLSPLEWVGGLLAGGVAYAGVLLGTREVSLEELSEFRAKAGAAISGLRRAKSESGHANISDDER